MKKQWTPARQAARSADFIYAEVIPHAVRELVISPLPLASKVAIVVSVPGYSPRESFKTQRTYWRDKNDLWRTPGPVTGVEVRWIAEERELSAWVWEMLKTGAAPAEIQAIIDGEQSWPWMAVVSDRDELERRLREMYRLAHCELDVDWKPTTIPCGFVIGGILHAGRP